MNPKLYFILACIGLVAGFLIGWAIVDSYTDGDYGQAFGRDLIIPVVGSLVGAVAFPGVLGMLEKVTTRG